MARAGAPDDEWAKCPRADRPGTVTTFGIDVFGAISGIDRAS